MRLTDTYISTLDYSPEQKKNKKKDNMLGSVVASCVCDGPMGERSKADKD